MKTQALRLLTLSLAASLAPAAFAAVTVNGTVFERFTMRATASGDIKLTTVPAAYSIPTPLLKAKYDVTVSSVLAGTTNIDIIPGPNVAAVVPVNCVTTPLDPACPVVLPPTPCGTVGAELVFETIPWASIPVKKTVTTGIVGAASKFTTSSSTTYKGYFTAVATTPTASMLRRMWISDCPGGVPITTNYDQGGVIKNACDITGTEAKLSWSQEIKPAYVTTCKLSVDKTYYLNYEHLKGTGSTPTLTSQLIRGASYSGTP